MIRPDHRARLGALALLAAALGASAVPGAAAAQNYTVNLSGEIGACCYIQGANASYTSGSGFTIANGGPSNFTTNPSPLTPGLKAASLGASADAMNVTSSGSLYKGELTTNATSNDGQYTFGGSLWSNALQDDPTFHVAGGGSALVTFEVAMNGNVTVPIGGVYNQTVGFSITGAAFTVDAESNRDGMPVPFSYYPYNNGFLNPTLTDSSLGGFTWTGQLEVTDGESLPFNLTQGGGVSDGAYGAFDLTLSLPDLPQGVTYTSGSGSGVFLTGSGVPEPAAWTTMLLGFAAVGGACRIARRRAARLNPA